MIKVVSRLLVKLKLTSKENLEQEFKTGFRCIKQEQVDIFLNVIIKDYESMHEIVDELQQENIRLKKQLEEQSRKQSIQPAGTTNFDILKRLSNLEKHVFGAKLDEQ